MARAVAHCERQKPAAFHRKYQVCQHQCIRSPPKTPCCTDSAVSCIPHAGCTPHVPVKISTAHAVADSCCNTLARCGGRSGFPSIVGYELKERGLNPACLHSLTTLSGVSCPMPSPHPPSLQAPPPPWTLLTQPPPPLRSVAYLDHIVRHELSHALAVACCSHQLA